MVVGLCIFPPGSRKRTFLAESHFPPPGQLFASFLRNRIVRGCYWRSRCSNIAFGAKCLLNHPTSLSDRPPSWSFTGWINIGGETRPGFHWGKSQPDLDCRDRSWQGNEEAQSLCLTQTSLLSRFALHL